MATPNLMNPTGSPIVDERLREVPPGMLAGLLGATGDLNELGRMGTGLLAQNPGMGPLQPLFGLLGAPRESTEMATSEDFGNLLGQDPSSPGFIAGTMLSPDPTGPVGKAGKAVGLATAGGAIVKGAKKAAKSELEKALDAAQKIERGETAIIPKVGQPLKARDLQPLGQSTKSRNIFLQRLNEARTKMDPADRAQVDATLPEGFDGDVYLTDNGVAGFALNKNGYVSNVFKDPNAPVYGVLDAAMTKARAAGAKNLEAFDTYLVRNYLRSGARETNRFPFDPDQSTPEIVAALGDERPDFVQMDIGGVIPTQKHSLILGPRVQRELERFKAARGEPKPVADYFRGGRTARLKRLTQKGVDQGGDKWYWLGGMLDQFIAEFGAKEGVKRFDRFMELNGATSPRSTVSKNIQRASYLYQREVNKVPFERLFQPPGSESNPKGLLKPHWPEGLGHLANNIHLDNVEYLLRNGAFNSVEQAKVASYVENLKGNYRPVTIDTHNNFVITGKRGKPTEKSPLGDPKGPTAAQLPFLEQRQQRLAEQMGLEPAEWQSALWVGAGDITGVEDVRNFPDAMNVRIAKTAEVLDIPEAEAFIRFMNGDTHLYSVMAALIGAGVLKEASDAEQSDRQATSSLLSL